MRKNGFATPFSRDQVTSWVVQPLIVAAFVAFVAALLGRDKCIGILVPYAALVLSALSAWFLCEVRDSAEPRPASALSCLRLPHKETRYCTICCKTSPGLDHHCSWLNTCIGERNYEAFYCLTLAATLQTALQTVVGVLMSTLWLDEVKRNAASSDWHLALAVLLWLHNACAFSLGSSYLLLAGFHTYLLCVGTGTYDFILENGSEGLCARLLKCNCLRRAKRNKPAKRSHVRAAGDDDEPIAAVPGPASGGKLSRRGSPTAAAKAAMQAGAGPKLLVGESAGKWKAPAVALSAVAAADKAKQSEARVEVNLNESEGIVQQQQQQQRQQDSKMDM